MGSIGNLLVPNNYNLYAESITVNQSTTEVFSAVPSGNQVLSAGGTFALTKVNYGVLLFPNSAYDTTLSVYTAPKSGVYNIKGRVGVDLVVSGNSIIGLSADLISNDVTTVSRSSKTDNYAAGLTYHLELDINWVGSLVAAQNIRIKINAPTGSGVANITSCQVTFADSYFNGFEI
jgi:hypothetical protein